MNLIFKAMLELQNKLNIRTLGPDWATTGTQDWYLAISQECAEGIDHLAWKWWTKQAPNTPAARLEAIDILHFILSAEMWAADQITLDVLADRLAKSWDERFAPVYLDEDEFIVADLTAIQLFRLISGLASVDRTSVGLLFLLADKLNLGVADATILYRQKATLNLFRQNNGYKDGTYIKHWSPNTEDNAYLDTLSIGINWAHASAQDLFYGRLNVKYLEVTQALTKH